MSHRSPRLPGFCQPNRRSLPTLILKSSSGPRSSVSLRLPRSRYLPSLDRSPLPFPSIRRRRVSGVGALRPVRTGPLPVSCRYCCRTVSNRVFQRDSNFSRAGENSWKFDRKIRVWIWNRIRDFLFCFIFLFHRFEHLWSDDVVEFLVDGINYFSFTVW